MKCSEHGRNNIKILEGVRRTLYQDCRGYDTIGCGHKVKLPEDSYLLAKPLTDQDIEMLLTKDLMPIEFWLTTLTLRWNTPITQYEFDALCSFIYNETKVMYHPEEFPQTMYELTWGDVNSITHIMMQFCNAVAGSNDQLLLKRREQEVALFKNGTYIQ